MSEDIVIVAAGRTAVGTFGGALAAIPASELGATVIKGLLERSGLKPEQINEVILGQVLTAGVGQNPARQAVLSADFCPVSFSVRGKEMYADICLLSLKLFSS